MWERNYALCLPTCRQRSLTELKLWKTHSLYQWCDWVGPLNFINHSLVCKVNLGVLFTSKPSLDYAWPLQKTDLDELGTISLPTCSLHIINDNRLTGDNIIRHGRAASGVLYLLHTVALPALASYMEQGLQFYFWGFAHVHEFRIIRKEVLFGNQALHVMRFYLLLKVMWTNLFQELILRTLLLIIFW